MSVPEGYETAFDWGGTVPTGDLQPDDLEFGDLSDVEMRPVVYAYKPLLQASAFHLLAGRKGVGKGTFLAHVCARITRGEIGGKRRVVWIALGEDSYEIDVKPRVVAAEGDPTLVKYLRRGRLRLPDDLRPCYGRPGEFGDVGLVIIDPLGGGTGTRNTNRDSDIRPGDRPAERGRLPARLRRATGVRHITNKKIEGGSLAGILGSSDWVNVPRAVLALVHDDEDDAVRHVQVVAGNRVRGSAGRTFRIVGIPVVDGGEDAHGRRRFRRLRQERRRPPANSNGHRDLIDKQALQRLILEQLETGAKKPRVPERGRRGRVAGDLRPDVEARDRDPFAMPEAQGAQGRAGRADGRMSWPNPRTPLAAIFGNQAVRVAIFEDWQSSPNFAVSVPGDSRGKGRDAASEHRRPVRTRGAPGRARRLSRRLRGLADGGSAPTAIRSTGG